MNIDNLPNEAALISNYNQILNCQAIKEDVSHVQDILKELNIKQVGLYLDNSPEWLIVSLASLFSDVTIVPLPVFFSTQQISHILSVTKLDGIIGNNPQVLCELIPEGTLTSITDKLFICSKNDNQSNLGQFSGILTFTSGSTGTPKGVLLPYKNVINQLNAIYEHLKPDYAINYLVLTPLSILLENIIAIDTLLNKGTVHVNSIHKFLNLSNFSIQVEELFHYISSTNVNTLLLMPLFLQQIVNYMTEHQIEFPRSVKFIALGGAFTSLNLLKKAQALKLPVYQGYGLSESCSIVSMNTIQNNKIGSVGKILPHVRVKIAEDNSVLVTGNLFQSYLGEQPIAQEEYYNTGDLGYIEEDYLYITGRKKNIMVLQNGRNVSPEWIENEILQIHSVAYVVVIGHAYPFVSVIIDPKPTFNREEFIQELNLINQNLPEFAQVRQFIIADQHFTYENKLLTIKQKPNNQLVIELYKDKINDLYS